MLSHLIWQLGVGVPMIAVAASAHRLDPLVKAFVMAMQPWRRVGKRLADMGKDESFLEFLKLIEGWVSKILSLAMVVVILVALFDLVLLLTTELANPPVGFFNRTLIDIFGIFLNVLIALEILENITAYLKKHVIQVELVIITALIAVARKLIIFDLSKASGLDLIGLAVALAALAIAYWVVRRANTKSPEA